MRSCSPRAGRTRSCTGPSSRSGRSQRVVGFGVMAAGRLLASRSWGLWQKSACHNPRSRNVSGRTPCWRPTEIATTPKTPTPGAAWLPRPPKRQRKACDAPSSSCIFSVTPDSAGRSAGDACPRLSARQTTSATAGTVALVTSPRFQWGASRRLRSSRTSRSWGRRPCCAGRCCRSPSP